LNENISKHFEVYMKKMNFLKLIILNLVSLFIFLDAASQTINGEKYENSLGMKMIRIEAGVFQMGTPDTDFESWDEEPVRRVTISNPFYISQFEVTIEQFQNFRSDFTGSMTEGPYAVGISWYDAVAFCEWLSKKEGKPYRLPTEAEWEYAARADTESSFWSGKEPPEPGQENPWGLKNIHSGPLEWCQDWYRPYPIEDQTDPVGPENGLTKIIRGGGLDRKTPYYARSANRASYGPSFAMLEGTKPEEILRDEEPSHEPKLTGLIGVWYGTTTFGNPKAVEHMTTLKVNWNDFQQPGEDRETKWSAQWEGMILAPYSGKITFIAASDYSLNVEIGGQTILSWEGLDTEKTGCIQMKRGSLYPVRIRYTHNQGENCFVDLRWKWKGQKPVVITEENLYHSSAQFQSYKKQVPRQYQPGHHSIGFRVVQAPVPYSELTQQQKPFIQECVVQNVSNPKQGPDPEKPWYRRNTLMPIPPTDASGKDSWAVGFSKGFWPHIHNSALVVCPNGDLLVSHYTAKLGVRGEDQPEVLLIGSRLRFGSKEWDMPDFFVDFADANTTSPCFYKEDDTLHFYCGHTFYDRHYPFQWMTSNDNGATWSEPYFPRVVGEIGPHTPQPINSVFRDFSGMFYVATDGYGSTSMLWASEDNGKTWKDTGGRTFGRHTTFALLKDGRILGMGGKKSQIEGYMPKSISKDRGKTWKIGRTPFSEMGGNQRPCLIRLQSGRLFMCGDFQHKTGRYTEAIKERGSYVALSEDDGETWHIKKLAGTIPHFEDDLYETIGYSAADQGPDGIIHIIATSTLPLLHYEINEAWILNPDAPWSLLNETEVYDVKTYKETYPSGQIKSIRKCGVSTEGEFLLNGKQVWYYESGQIQYEVNYAKGKKLGEEIYWCKNGKKGWEWFHKENGSRVWIRYWPNGQKMSESHWRYKKAEGSARRWDMNGNLINDNYFWNGRKL
jgi:formylglycine-generating enzyme required for sulfatase activity